MFNPTQKIYFIKVGGSLITDKQVANSVREHALQKIAFEVYRATQLGVKLVIGHGAGSFAHVPAHRYQTHKGILTEESFQGLAAVAHAAKQLNQIVMEALLLAGVNAVSISPLSTMGASNFELESIDTRSIEQVLQMDMIPVVYGDAILDKKRGCTIFSTERVLGYLAIDLQKRGYTAAQIIHCGRTNGVYDLSGNTIPLITQDNYKEYESMLTGSDGVDVTGGMLHKVNEALSLAKQGIPGLIIDGIEHGSLSDAISGKPVLGTAIAVE